MRALSDDRRSSCAIAVVGDSCIDTYLDRAGVQAIGGNALNVAVCTARRYGNAAYVGPVGDDPAGKWVVEFLVSRGVAIDHVRMLKGSTTAQTALRLGGDGDRVIVDENYEILERYDLSADDIRYLRRAGRVHVAGSLRLRRRLEVLCREVPVSYDFSIQRDSVSVAGLDVAFFSGQSLARSAAEQLAKGAVRQGAVAAVVTLGSRGSFACEGRQMAFVRALDVDVVDTCGSGDAYIAAFLERRAAGDVLQECMLAGSRAGAEACTILGPSPQNLSATVGPGMASEVERLA